MAGAYRDSDATVAAKDGVPVTPSDATVFPVCRALYVGVSGTIVVRHPGVAGGPIAASVTYANVPVGIFPVQADMVLSTGTTATSLVALY